MGHLWGVGFEPSKVVVIEEVDVGHRGPVRARAAQHDASTETQICAEQDAIGEALEEGLDLGWRVAADLR